MMSTRKFLWKGIKKRNVSVHGKAHPVNTYRGTLVDEEMFALNNNDFIRLDRSICLVVILNMLKYFFYFNEFSFTFPH